MRYLDFMGGSGVRYLTILVQNGGFPFDEKTLNASLFYTYEGLTSDGQFCVVATFPLSVNLTLPPPPVASSYSASADYYAAMNAYNQMVTNALTHATDDQFNPMLAALDVLVTSIQLAPALQFPPSPPTKPPSLRTVDWAGVFAHDPDLQVRDGSAICHYGEIDPAVTLKSNAKVNGRPVTDNIEYGDISGDGGEEAVIGLLTSCTGGVTNALVYRMTPNGPKIVASIPEEQSAIGVAFTIGTRIIDGRLEVTHAIYRSGDPHAAPSGGKQITLYRLQGDQLVQLGSRVIPPATVAPTPPLATTLPTPRPTAAAQTTWTSPSVQVKLVYPSQWRATRDTSDQYSILELDSPDSVFFYLSAYVPGSPAAAKSALDGIQGYKDRQTKSAARRVVSQGAIQQTTVNGRRATFMEFQTVNVKNSADVHTGVVWYIDGPDRQYVIEAFALGTTFRSRDVISSIITSIRFSP